ncbi:hypothetical protein [Streptomyces albofaciens]|uniref:hypothetical protein n=1 Tax=Streptomyces albofaciens TaxID=66866 RepID=UPI00123BEE94|nr:hypothetical protein [Streptomyces albofaciens]
MTQNTQDDPNRPLPRKSREDSEAWAKQYVSAMAHYAGVTLDTATAPHVDFQDCVGRNDEVADDGRYTLKYTAYANLPLADHEKAVGKLREALEKDGEVRITAYEEKPRVILYGHHSKEKFDIIADSVKPPNTLRLSVGTPCFLPPGAKQQRF